MAASMAIDTGQTTIALAIQKLVARGALFVVNHSGGKDSQAMFLYLFGLVPKEQLLIIHAVLPEVDWPDIESHILDNYEKEVSSEEIGNLCMEFLRDVDQVAFVRFASVYRSFGDAQDFVDELAPILKTKAKAKKKKSGKDTEL